MGRGAIVDVCCPAFADECGELPGRQSAASRRLRTAMSHAPPPTTATAATPSATQGHAELDDPDEPVAFWVAGAAAHCARDAGTVTGSFDVAGSSLPLKAAMTRSDCGASIQRSLSTNAHPKPWGGIPTQAACA